MNAWINPAAVVGIPSEKTFSAAWVESFVRLLLRLIMTKKEYEVCVPITGIILVTVEAESEKEAIKAAFESEQLTLNHVEEWEAHEEICTGNVLHASQNTAYAVEVKLEFVIQEVGGDLMDRFPGHNEVTRVRVSFDGTPSA